MIAESQNVVSVLEEASASLVLRHTLLDFFSYELL